jgi:hypothetical protein
MARDRGLCSSTSSCRSQHASATPTMFCHSAILHLSARTRDNVLTLRGPGDEVVTQKHCITRSGSVSVRTTSPVSISVDNEVRLRGAVNKQAVVEDALEVRKDELHGREMRLTRVMYMEAHLLDRVGNIGPGEGGVLESPSQAAVGSRVIDGGPMSEETLA